MDSCSGLVRPHPHMALGSYRCPTAMPCWRGMLMEKCHSDAFLSIGKPRKTSWRTYTSTFVLLRVSKGIGVVEQITLYMRHFCNAAWRPPILVGKFYASLALRLPLFPSATSWLTGAFDFLTHWKEVVFTVYVSIPSFLLNHFTMCCITMECIPNKVAVRGCQKLVFLRLSKRNLSLWNS